MTKARKRTAHMGPKPGLYRDVPFGEYLAWPFVNNSLLQHGKRSMAHLRTAELSADRTSTKAKDLGSFVHTAVLEYDSIEARYVVLPAFENDIRRDDGSAYDNPKATKAYKSKVEAFRKRHADKEIVSQSDLAAMLAVRDSLTLHERARKYLNPQFDSEVSLIWDDPLAGIRCKARIDKLDLDGCAFTDVKTTRDASQFRRFIANYGYHQQLAFYADGLHVLTGTDFEARIVAIEMDEPYLIRAAPLSESALECGRWEYTRILAQLAESRRTGCWPGYDDPDAWELPDWHDSPDQPVSLHIGGQLVTI